MTTKLVTQLVVGDRLPCVRTVMSVTSTTTGVEVSFDDGTSQSWVDLTGDPAVEIVDG